MGPRDSDAVRLDGLQPDLGLTPVHERRASPRAARRQPAPSNRRPPCASQDTRGDLLVQADLAAVEEGYLLIRSLCENDPFEPLPSETSMSVR